MQPLFQVVFLAASVAVLLQPVDGEAEGHVHLRVASGGPSQQKVGEWQQCKWIEKRLPCDADAGLVCIEPFYYWGQCVKKEMDLWGQCGGYAWTTNCVAGAKCEWRDAYYSQCVPSSTRNGEPEWAQCQWESYTKTCATSLQCAVESKWYGQCVKKQADLWGQCGGLNWTATCKSGKCVKLNDYYSQCQP